MKFQKQQGKNVHWASRGHETQFLCYLIWWVFIFSWTPSTNHRCCYVYVAINALEPRALNSESQYFIPLFNKISWLCRQQPGGDEASNEGCNSGPTVRDFTDNFIMLWNVLGAGNCAWIVWCKLIRSWVEMGNDFKKELTALISCIFA
jgi:hypothetical protein